MATREAMREMIEEATRSVYQGEYTREAFRGLYTLIKDSSPDRELWSTWNAFEARCTLKGIVEPTPLKNTQWYSGLTGRNDQWSFVKTGLQEQQLLIGHRLRSKASCIWRFFPGGRIKAVEVYDPQRNRAELVFSLTEVVSEEVPFTAKEFSPSLKEAIAGNVGEEDRNYYDKICMLGHTFARDLAQNFWDHSFRMWEFPEKLSPYRPLPEIVYNKYLAYAIRGAASLWTQITKVRIGEGSVNYQPYLSKKRPAWM